MKRLALHPLLLVAALVALTVVPALAQGEGEGEPADDEGSSAPPAPAFLPTGPATVENPNESAEEPEFGRPRVAVIPFVETYSAEGQIVATGAIGDILQSELSKTGRFNLVVRKEMMKELIQNAQIEQGSGLMDLSTVSDLGKYKGVDYLLQGRISHASAKSSGMDILGFGQTKESAKIRIDFQLVKAETGEIMYSGIGEGSGSTSSTMLGEYGGLNNSSTSAGLFGNAIVGACRDMVTDIEKTDLFPVRAVVKGTAGEKVVIDLGQSTGMYVGLELDLRAVEVLRDDETGEYLMAEMGDIFGSIVLDEVQIDRSVGHIATGRKPSKGELAEVPKNVTLRRPDDSKAGDADDDRQKDKNKKDKEKKEEIKREDKSGRS